MIAGAATGCQDPAGERARALDTPLNAEVPVPDVPVPPADGPQLGAIANVTPVYDRPSTAGQEIGYLHAGARVARAAEPYTREGCDGGWYPIRPAGFVCAGASATIELDHPTLVAMSIQPEIEAHLPYTYARLTKATHTFTVDAKREQGVTRGQQLSKASGMAVVGSWDANDDQGGRLRLAMMTNGRFVPASDLEKAEASSFAGVELDEEVKLPVAFVVKRGVRAWALDGKAAERRAALDYHRRFDLTGTYRTLDKVEFWETTEGTWLRHIDVTIVRRRHSLPEFARGDQKWIDVSIVTGTLVLYEGTRPVFATLVSPGRDRLGDPQTTASTARGEFRVVAKHITGASVDPASLADGASVFDVPWALELASGQLLHGAYWHDRFGIEHGPGNLQVSPADARRIWAWADPQVPAGWHGVRVRESEPTVIVNVRK
jgi:hypothetical protein